MSLKWKVFEDGLMYGYTYRWVDGHSEKFYYVALEDST